MLVRGADGVGSRRWRLRAPRMVALGMALAVAFAALCSVAGASGNVALADPKSLTVDITQPAASGGQAEGPVGANLVVQGTAPSGDTVQLGIATSAAACATSAQPLNLSATAGGNGNFNATFPWPQFANTVGATYVICAADTTASAVAASPTTFRVDSDTAPAINVTEVADPNATVGPGTATPAPPNPPDGSLYAGGFVKIDGQNFTPGGTSIKIIVTAPGPLTPDGSSGAGALKIVQGDPVTSRSGTFSVVAQLPNTETGQFTISAVSNDGTSSALPSLTASQSAQIVAAPQPTVTPSPTVSATASTVPTTTPKSSSGSPGPVRVVAAIGLGLLSAIFFVLGIIMLVSGANTPVDETPSSPGQPRTQYR